jgi:hypothetical protein
MFWSRVGAGIVPLVSQPESVDTTESNAGAPRDSQEVHGIAPQFKNLPASGAPAVPVLGQSDVPTPRNLDLERMQPSVNTAERRPSVDSEASVYEEANADVAVETAKAAEIAESAETVTSAEATVDTAEPLVDQPQSPSGPGHDITNILTRSDS